MKLSFETPSNLVIIAPLKFADLANFRLQAILTLTCINICDSTIAFGFINNFFIFSNSSIKLFLFATYLPYQLTTLNIFVFAELIASKTTAAGSPLID